ncbi:tol-pal system protein YbgF [Rubrivivax gelatinosus]|uniref:Cell division coordinator CpoB n=1 Tax=Rubrivivax gelatinosus TaxID=28068 RepID=A0ABS1DUL8_RUBGE|nr:tol-pal system protein YbgF [Rubrivivax gelatinosus]MBK1613280.1 tol-pal system protein YbgF [Rubrivivax gelatinosus]MBK1713354.1 tol-pal system protein YbgF [Rubrivivax gelatinosus]
MALAALVVVGGPAQAGLFDDEEARKAILDLRQRVRATEEQSAATAAQQNETIESLRRNLLSLNNELEALRAEVARLRGSDEQLVRDVTDLQRRQKDASQVLDDRLRKLEPTKVSIDGREFAVSTDERAAYEEAMGVLRTGDFDKASSALSGFVARYPTSGYVDSARFWLGNAQYGRRDYKGAIATFRAFVAAAPQHPRAPEALLALANSQAEAKDTRAARRTIEELLKAYPQSEAAAAGKERLASLK